MSDAPRRRPPRNIPALLAELRQERFSGAVVVVGGPGGALHLHGGLIVAVETPAAPTAESVLLKSGRITEADWAGARAATPPGGPLRAALIGGGLVGAAELDMVCTAALFDGAFAMALNPATGWRVDPAVPAPELAASPGEEPARIAAETARRLAVLRRHWTPLGEFVRAPVRPAPSARDGVRPLDARRSRLLLGVDGRRTPVTSPSRRAAESSLSCSTWPGWRRNGSSDVSRRRRVRRPWLRCGPPPARRPPRRAAARKRRGPCRAAPPGAGRTPARPPRSATERAISAATLKESAP